jgi:hypothetical protein
MITYAIFKSNIEKLLNRQITNDEMIELCGEPLYKLLQETFQLKGLKH